MQNGKISKERLEQRRDEIIAQLDRVNRDLRYTMDPDSEEQAIESEQEQVPIAIEENLRKELAEIEDMLLDLQ